MRINFEKDVLIGTAVNQSGSKLTVDGTITAHRGTSVIPAYNFWETETLASIPPRK